MLTSFGIEFGLPTPAATERIVEIKVVEGSLLVGTRINLFLGGLFLIGLILSGRRQQAGRYSAGILPFEFIVPFRLDLFVEFHDFGSARLPDAFAGGGQASKGLARWEVSLLVATFDVVDHVFLTTPQDSHH